MGKLIIDGNSVYEVDEECIQQKEKEKKEEKERGIKQEETKKRLP